MLEEVVLIVSAEERLDSIWTFNCSVGNIVCIWNPEKMVNNSLLQQ